MYNILSITSYSGVGKTTLVEAIVRELCQRGYKVGTIKHTCHDFDVDKEGKDSYKHRKAGASKVCVISNNRVVYIEEREEEKNLKEIISMYKDMDIIIIEGYKNYRFKKIEITRQDKYKEIISNTDDLIGIVSDLDYNLDIKQFKLDEYKSIVNYLEKCIIEKKIEIDEYELDKIINEKEFLM